MFVTGTIAGVSDVGGKTVSNAGSRDILVAKLDKNGNTIWAKSYGGNKNDLGQSIVVDGSGNAYLTGSFGGTAKFGSTTLTSVGKGITLPNGVGEADVFVAKISGSSGNVFWAKNFGGSGYDTGFSISVDSSGLVFATGNISNGAKFGSTTLASPNGESNIFVAKISGPTGNLYWAKSFGGNGHDDGSAVVADSSGGVYVAGDIVGNVTFGSTTLTNSNPKGGTERHVRRTAQHVRASPLGEKLRQPWQ